MKIILNGINAAKQAAIDAENEKKEKNKSNVMRKTEKKEKNIKRKTS